MTATSPETSNRLDMSSKVGKFLAVFTIATLCCAKCWGLFVADHFYNCTDSSPGTFDYFTPGDWVHSWKPIQFVSEVHNSRSMEQPDVIKKGWSITALWSLWLTMITVSLALSAFAATSGWRTRKIPKTVLTLVN